MILSFFAFKIMKQQSDPNGAPCPKIKPNFRRTFNMKSLSQKNIQINADVSVMNPAINNSSLTKQGENLKDSVVPVFLNNNLMSRFTKENSNISSIRARDYSQI